MAELQFCLRVFANRPTQMAEAADHLVKEIATWAAKIAAPQVALAGGTTPTAMYPLLAARQWHGVQFMPTDERCVPEDHPRSNIGMLRRTLGADKNIVPLVEGEEIKTTGMNGSELLAPHAVLLGAGTDGHIASLFADLPMDNKTRKVQRVRPAGQPEERLTLPMATLAAAPFLLLLICGDDKFRLLGESADGNLPLTRLLAMRQNLAQDTWIYYAQ